MEKEEKVLLFTSIEIKVGRDFRYWESFWRHNMGLPG